MDECVKMADLNTVVSLMALGYAIATFLSGFILIRRTGFVLMTHLFTVMLVFVFGILTALTVWIGTSYHDLTVYGLFVFALLAILTEAWYMFGTLRVTMQGAPIHSAHLSNLTILVFISLAALSLV